MKLIFVVGLFSCAHNHDEIFSNMRSQYVYAQVKCVLYLCEAYKVTGVIIIG